MADTVAYRRTDGRSDAEAYRRSYERSDDSRAEAEADRRSYDRTDDKTDAEDLAGARARTHADAETEADAVANP